MEVTIKFIGHGYEVVTYQHASEHDFKTVRLDSSDDQQCTPCWIRCQLLRWNV